MVLPGLVIEEKKMFRGLTFMVNGKMCIGVSGHELMVRFDPNLHNEFCEKDHFRPMVTKGKEYKGYTDTSIPTILRQINS